MPRRVARPPFPDTPGAWLANYRYRQGGETSHPPSPELLGGMLGVSGPTLRRWEAGQAQPSTADLRRFAEVCSLAPLETEFLLRAFSGKQREKPPDEATFRAAAVRLLATDFPAYILDSFFYARAWNSYVQSLFDSPTDPEVHVLCSLMRIMARGDATREQAQQTQRWLRDFWLSTAELCGSEPYRRVLASLCGEPGFADRWCRLALQPDDLHGQALWAPYPISVPGIGSYRAFPTTIMLPPIYQVREYVPVDATAQRRLEAFRGLGPHSIGFSPHVHWAADPLLSRVD